MLGRARRLVSQTTPELGVCRWKEEAFITARAFVATYSTMYQLSLLLGV